MSRFRSRSVTCARRMSITDQVSMSLFQATTLYLTYLLFQVWDFEGEHYDYTFFVVEENLATREVRTHAMRSKYYAISTGKLSELMLEAGLQNVRRLDGIFFQPVLIGTRGA